MTTVIETVMLGDEHRLRVHCEEGSECPRGNWHMLTGYVNIPGRGDSRLLDVPAVHKPPIDIAEAHERLGARYSQHADTDLVERWARIFHGLHVEYDSEHGGYWFVAGADVKTYGTGLDTDSRALFYDNWPNVAQGSPEALELQARIIEQDQEVYRQWAQGEVYWIEYQERVTWQREAHQGLGDPAEDEDHGKVYTMHTWEHQDSLGDVYADPGQTFEQLALSIALEYFPLPESAEAEARRLHEEAS